MPNLTRETGIALPVTIFVIALLTITLAASFARVDADRAVARGTEDAVTALSLAESGLQFYMGNQTARPSNGDSVRVNLTGGYADVVVHVIQQPTDTFVPQMFAVRSTGRVIVPEQGAIHMASRTVAQFAYWQVGVIRQFAAFTAANEMNDRWPYRITMNGIDLCGDSANAGSARSESDSDLGGSGQGTYTPTSPVNSGGASTVANLTGVNWSMFVNGSYLADYSTVVVGESLYKSHVIQGNATLTGSGTGLLAVTGDLTTSGTLARWDGLVLVGGEIFFNADSTAFLGMVATGLRELTGGSAPYAEIGAKPVYIHYDSCRIGQSIAGLTGFVPVRNAWVDNWATY